ncbi:MAG: sulfatase [Planctomycetales bacterium]|nr:sulfatase [Planctomycetales bacterium]
MSLWLVSTLATGVWLSDVRAADGAADSGDAKRPNVILFIGDDINWNDYGCYGNEAARTPAIDSLAAHGVRFTQAFLTASSCSPSRSSIVTGRYPHNNGPGSELHQPISAHLPWFPALLKEAGYYTAIVGKHHMTSDAPDKATWSKRSFDVVDGSRAKGNTGGHANWVQTVEQRPKDQPFFFWFAAYDAHRDWDGDRQWRDEYGEQHSPADVRVPPYLADDAPTRRDLASYYNEVTRFDHYIGLVVETLRRQDALDNTLLLVMADNGRPFPRAKTRLHDSGMKTGLVAHWPAGIGKQGDYSHLVSAIDLAPTILELAGVPAPATMQGVSLAGALRDASTGPVRKFAFSEHNWHDYEAHGRGVRDGKYLYIRNHRPQQAWQGPADSVRSPSHQQLRALRDKQQLTPAQADIFLAPRPIEELYDTQSDPRQLRNLADDEQHRAARERLSAALRQWTEETGDSAPERISQDSFDRETGKSLKVDDYRGQWPGSDRHADRINAPGPR